LQFSEKSIIITRIPIDGTRVFYEPNDLESVDEGIARRKKSRWRYKHADAFADSTAMQKNTGARLLKKEAPPVSRAFSRKQKLRSPDRPFRSD